MALFETVSGIKHDAYRDALALLKPTARQEKKQFLAEDADSARQALIANAAVAVYALPTVAPEFMDGCARADVPLYVMGGGLMQKLLGVAYETNITVLTIARQVASSSPVEWIAGDSGALILCGETIQDPRNVGVLVRTAEASGCAGLLLSSDSADVWGRQSVRSTTGSIFRLPIHVADDLPQMLAQLKEKGASVVATSARRGAGLVYDADLSRRPMVLCVGNETRGVTEKLRAVADAFVRLPMPEPKTGGSGAASSLNVTVAAGALLYEAIRQRLAISTKK